MAKAKNELTVAQMTYIEQNFGKKSAEQIAADTGVGILKVKSILKKFEEAGFQPVAEEASPKKKKTPVEKAGFAVDHGKDADGNPGKVGTVSMTKAGSEKGDDFREGKVKPRNEKFFQQRVRNGIHVIDPSRPVY